MKLWILRPVEGLAYNIDNPWEPWYDKAFGFVVRADTEEEARKLAESDSGDESYGGTPWLDAALSTCAELLPEGDACVVMKDFHSA
jgi:hypothetical protein